VIIANTAEELIKKMEVHKKNENTIFSFFFLGFQKQFL
jgi:hypothetical protein